MEQKNTDSYHLKKAKELRACPGIKVFNEGRNDGWYIHKRVHDTTGVPLIAIAPFYEHKGELWWQKQKIKKSPHFGIYNLVIIGREKAEEAAESLMKVVGSLDNLKERLEEAKDKKDILNLADEFSF